MVSCKASSNAVGEGDRTLISSSEEDIDHSQSGNECRNGWKRTEAALQFCMRVLKDLGFYTRWLENGHVDAFGLCEMLCWVSHSTTKGKPISWKVQTILKSEYLTIPKVRDSVLKLQDQMVCQSRLWKLADATEWGICFLPSLMDALGRFELSNQHRTDHKGCNPQTCLLSDINATRVEQLHICGKSKCQQIVCPGEKLNRLENDKVSGAWIVKSQRALKSVGSLLASINATEGRSFTEITDNTRYLAISHVWSDGTGIGLKQPGFVNKCLLEFFERQAIKLKCDSIWWDTICVPTDRDQRQKALRRMHKNFSQATHTLVHDKELVNFTWKQDGSPCLALALSTWFTRGWTALELYASESVKVLFAGQNGEHVIKDLDDDILAFEFDPFAHPAWIEVSHVIRRIRKTNFWMGAGRPISHILHILNSRYTCWAQDRVLIASLMADMALDAKLVGNKKVILGNNSQPGFDQAENTKAILKKLEFITQSSLLHGQVTISGSGPWSWCPLSLFDLSLPTPHEMVVQLESEGEHEGCIKGTWLSTPLSESDIAILEPLYVHPATLVRITEALKDWANHRLLAASGRDMLPWRESYLLVKHLGGNLIDGSFVCTRYAYIGTLKCNRNRNILVRMKREHIFLV